MTSLGEGEYALLDQSWHDAITPDAARRMLIAAAHAFADKGYHATTTRDIAARAGMSPAAVYIHYRSKEDLLFQISKVGHERSLKVLTAVQDPDPRDRMAKTVAAFARWHAEFRTTARVVQYELGSLSPEHHAVVAELRRKIETHVRQIVEDGVKAGSFETPDQNGTALAVLSLCIDVARWYRPDGKRTPEDIGTLYADLALRMLSKSV
ncbi:TetR/AcrR family transcriptional regulator [Umezawaea endophytica]|uniref:TetR/AcrR family transcriptional regulator n=1 Tax=Umezawaea endophytica TaxID=1654476 RepID=A0A9X2VV90_9PSEU|nr:TetR/AcrR family transcriptional regulator [Umezawaea endophytica]MCS7482827.1 TetR/AcrR family transcriptional regulator [Umezawaea endophytica]